MTNRHNLLWYVGVVLPESNILYDEETEQLSDDLVNVKGEVADLTKTAKNTQGISLFTDASQKNYKQMVQYLGEIADEWDQISEKNQTNFCLYVQKCA